ncbi:MAG: hypothetical protein Q8M55_01805 [Actinomycetota bacterium]|nr:hypothetical protein [Actinomycetota bacterium]
MTRRTADPRPRVAPPLLRCPECGYVAEGVRCPRCNALKVSGCTGGCLTCRSKCPVPKG